MEEKNKNGNEEIINEQKQNDKESNKWMIALWIFIAVFLITDVFIFANIFLKDKNKNDNVVQKVDTESRTEAVKQEILGKKEEEKTTFEVAVDNNKSEIFKEYENLSDKEKEKIDSIPRENDIPMSDEKLDDIKEEIIKEDEKETEDLIPEKFNLKDVIKIDVEDQGSYGLCWDFASTKSLETFLALNEKKEYNFSEIQVDYVISDEMYGFRPLHDGGNFAYFNDFFKVSAYDNEGKYTYNKEYSAEEYYDFVKDDGVYVTKTVDFPSLYKENGKLSNEDITDEQLNEFRDLVKRHIMKNGSLYTAIEGRGDKNLYCSEGCFTNHAVSIVGWDDTYSKNNFSDNGKKPIHDGAYIALNSWGKGFGDDGYFYISYDDQFVESQMSGVLSTSFEDAINVTSIKNKKVRDYITTKFKTNIIKYNGRNYIFPTYLNGVFELELDKMDLTSADLQAFMEYFPNVNTLSLKDNNISDVSFLKNIKDLYYIDLSNNNVKDVSDLADVTIYNLNLSGNKGVVGYDKISSVDSLNISDTDTTNLDVLAKMDDLYVLDVSNNKGIDLSVIKDLNIVKLNASDCDLSDLSFLDGVTNLNSLDVSKNKLETLDGIEKIKILELNISENKITDFSALKKIEFDEEVEYEYDEPDDNYDIQNCTGEDYFDEYWGLHDLTCENCGLKDITVFNEIPIDFLYLGKNDIVDVSNFNNRYVYYLNLDDNNVQIGLEFLNEVYDISLRNNNITDIGDISKLKELRGIDLSNNQIANVDLLKDMENLHYINLSGNKDMSGTFGNNIDGLNLENCGSLKNLKFSSFREYADLTFSKDVDLDLNIFNDFDNLYVYVDDYEITDLSELDNYKFSFNGYKYIIDVNAADLNPIKDKKIKKLLMNSYLYSNVKNATYDKKCDYLKSVDSAKDIEFEYVFYDYNYYSKIALRNRAN